MGEHHAPVALVDRVIAAVRLVRSDDDGPHGAFFAARQPVEVARGFVIDAFTCGASAAELIAGRPVQRWSVAP